MKHAALSTASAFALLVAPTHAQARQVFPPGSFSIDGTPVICGRITFVLDPALRDIGRARPGVILLNPDIFDRLPTTLKLFFAGHECGHHVVGLDETAADCWAIRTGRDQGWFPPAAFRELIALFRHNRGDIAHPPGPQRVRAMQACYARP